MSRSLFCDWSGENLPGDKGQLFAQKSFTDYKILFFDPIQFCLNNDLRKNRTEIWSKEYYTYDETDYLLYLSRSKALIEKIHDFLGQGGIWVIRCNFPNSNIAVRKKSSASSGQYTKTVISPFFWIQEFLGKYDFQYGSDNSCRFIDHNNPLYRIFRNRAVEAPLAHNRIPKGKSETWADNGQSNHHGVITRVHFPPDKGEIYLIPRFVCDGEADDLVRAFDAIAEHRALQEGRPKWLGRYNQQLERSNPYVTQLEMTERKIEQLTEKRDKLRKVKEETEYFIEILYENGDAFHMQVCKAFGLLGFKVEEMPAGAGDEAPVCIMKDGKNRLIVQTTASRTGTPSIETVQKIQELAEAGGANAKAMVASNSSYAEDPGNRGKWFSNEIEQFARKNEIILMPSLELFKMICYALSKSDSDNSGDFKKSLRKDMFDSDSVFKFNEAKYRAAPPSKVGVV